MLGTKIRAVRAGFVRFVLGLTKSTSPVYPSGIIESFQHYMRQEGAQAGRAKFVAILDAHLRDHGFCSDMEPLLRNGISYETQVAGSYPSQLVKPAAQVIRRHLTLFNTLGRYRVKSSNK